jgi:dTMP kinase
MTGRFITIEGGEGSGKSTLIQRLKSHLSQQGIPVVTTREPGGSALGEAIRDLLLHNKNGLSIGATAELLLFLAARAQHLEELIRPALARGKTVICDRFNDSTIAYQGAARNLEPSQIETLCSFVSGTTTPHLTLLLDIDPLIGLERAKKSRQSMDRLESEQIAFHNRVRDAFRTLAATHPERIILIDATLTPEKVFEKALAEVYRIHDCRF